MNWNKSKNKLILLFLGINILLGWVNYRKASSSYLLKGAQIQDIRQVMSENNMMVETAIPRRFKPLQKLTVFPYQMNSAEREEIVKRIFGSLDKVKVSLEPAKEPDKKPRRVYTKDYQHITFEGEKVTYHHDEMGEDVVDISTAKKMAEKWLRQAGYSPGKMHLQVIDEPKDWQIIYYDKYKDMPVFDSYVKLKITPLGIAHAKIHKVELGKSTGEKQAIYPIDQVFFYLMNLIGNQEKPVVIQDIMIGYGLENPKGTHLIAEKAIPFYQIILENGEIYYINAYNNEIRMEITE